MGRNDERSNQVDTATTTSPTRAQSSIMVTGVNRHTGITKTAEKTMMMTETNKKIRPEVRLKQPY